MHAQQFRGTGLVAAGDLESFADGLFAEFRKIEARQAAGGCHRDGVPLLGRHLGLHLEHIGLLDHVFQLTHVAGPVERAELRDRVTGRNPLGQPVAICEPLREEVDVGRDVLRPLPEGRNAEFDHVESVVEVFSERALLNLLFEVAIGRRHDLHVDRYRFRGSDRQDLALLQNPQEFGLEFHRHLPDLVEEDHAAFGCTKDAQRSAVGSGEGTLLVTEELALGERRREGRAVHGDKRLIPPRAAAMQEPRPEFLAGAGLAAHQHRAFDFRGTFDRLGDPPHRGAGAEHPVAGVSRPGDSRGPGRIDHHRRVQ